MIVLDTVRWDSTSLDPNSANQTPELAKIAGQGFVFSNAYAVYDFSVSSHFTLFTGLRHMNISGAEDFDRPENSLAHHLNQRGYTTAGVSANLLLTQRTKGLNYLKAFQTYHNYPEEHPIDTILRNPGEFETVKRELGRYDCPLTRANALMILADAGNIVTQALDVVDARDAERPLFLFINFMDAHTPYFPPAHTYDIQAEEPLLDFYSDILKRPIPRSTQNVDKEAKLGDRLKQISDVARRNSPSSSNDLSPAHLARYKARYEACVRYLDEQVGRLFREFRTRRLLDNSIVVILSDHGEAFGEDDTLGHAHGPKVAYEPTFHVPLVIIPENTNNIQGGSVIRDKVSIMDIVPTIHDALGIANDTSSLVAAHGDEACGKSLAPLMGNCFPDREATASFTVQSANAGAPAMDKELEDRLKALGYIE